MKAIYLTVTAGLLLLALAVSPGLAGEKIFTEGPVISVSVSGSNQFSPDSDAVLPLLVENRGLIDMKLVQLRYVTPDYLPTTARSVKVTLLPGNSPVTVKSDTQVIGLLPSGIVEEASFDIHVPDNAPAGTYAMTARVEYEYMQSYDQSGLDAITYHFKTVTEEIPVTVVVTPSVILAVTDVQSSDVNAGGEGYVTMSVTNTGTDNASHFALYIEPGGYGPLTPVEGNIYIGDFAAGETITPRVKVSVSQDADATQQYPLTVFGVYKDYEGMDAMTSPVLIGVDFLGKITFDVVSEPAAAEAGDENLIHVTYKNTGAATAYQAQGRISVVDPFSSTDSNVYLGDMKPGESAEAVYRIQVDKAATIKKYSLDSEIRYTDSLNNNYVSDTVKVIVDVQPADNTGMYIIAIIGVLVVAGGGWYLLRRKQHSGRQDS
ncbi:COG1361 S-layer family protein [Methanogenium organophilum]|uniref:LPXTG cell wall anchor domain-containing protein n=1 Tax=Methanogenium organophilum TaxID=2199 RepID=A0A9X9S5Z4_METOG|nr:LPXTG cell wall anchor domain-containing protein [Methanogenium organophilum]WAI02055.1 LPXTG cell wall anchor domain-containing protein [Methanogenium organophilum]